MTSLCASTHLIFADAPVVDVTQTNSGESGYSADVSNSYQSNEMSPQETSNPTINQSRVTLPTDNSSSDQSAVASQDNMQSLSMQQRVARLEQQMANLIRMNLPDQITQLQQSLQNMQGQLQTEDHNLKILSEQQKRFYQDLNQRLLKLSQRVTGTQSANTTPNQDSDGQSANTDQTNLQDSNQYKQAFQLLIKKKYDQASLAFTDYLKQHADGHYVANAHYWLGEIYALQKQYQLAINEFNIVLKQFPRSNKIPDTKLKLAIIQANMGQVKKAIKNLNKIKRQYAGTTAAQLATIQLQQIQTKMQEAKSVSK